MSSKYKKSPRKHLENDTPHIHKVPTMLEHRRKFIKISAIWSAFWHKISQNKSHRSFRRSYREDYVKDEEMRGVLSQNFYTIGIIKKNWKLFLSLLLFSVIAHIILTGLMSEATYKNFQKNFDETNLELSGGRFGNFAKASLMLASTVLTGGLSQAQSDTQQVFGAVIFLVVWLVGIFIIRAYMKKQKIKFRDALYNALSPLISVTIVFLIGFIQMIPVFLTIIIYSAAKLSDFLSTPFYALTFFLFASVMILISFYLIPGTLLALVAVSAPGMYPLPALTATNTLIVGRRIKITVRIVFMLFFLGIFWIILGLPVILLDFLLKVKISFIADLPIVPVWLVTLTSMSFIYATTYLYTMYRDILNLDKKNG